ncbi:short-chain dehydrogenase [Leisingera sp. ANG-M1]|uniref:hypothetical protein n=1 Tax=unclassified Leisingera TaxID=2614906 RepID=UPI00057F0BB4|nr:MULTISPECIES: hypothetical protein [unclassified Leisingera]KIC11907.1 short-chain dehydrogenase [Leisingera sp. ANG-M1]KIC13875.1 short-chain dehydrogenase [Leisingera sp. ANG-Vp]
MRVSGSDVLFKIVAIFLVVMAVLAMFGKLRFPGQKHLNSKRCPSCGRFKIGKGPCGCQKGGRGK